MMEQSDLLDLFEVLSPATPWLQTADEKLGWEDVFLSYMRANGYVICCFPGFAGAVCERLVAKGLAVREDAGFLDPTKGVAPEIQATSKFKAHVRGYWKEPAPQFRYTAVPAQKEKAA